MHIAYFFFLREVWTHLKSNFTTSFTLLRAVQLFLISLSYIQKNGSALFDLIFFFSKIEIDIALINFPFVSFN